MVVERWRLGALLVAMACFVLPSLAGLGVEARADDEVEEGSEQAVSSREEFRFTDPRITESSGLVVADGYFVTTNDSGDAGRIYTVDPETGDTVGTTTYAEDATDVEALAPAGNREVWVADIGANAAPRRTVSVTRVPFGPDDETVDVPSYDLVYPDNRSRDAESLLVEPGTGQLFVLTKEVFGGALYRAPEELSEDGPNRLERTGDQRLIGIATDAAFLPDGEHVVVRDYSRAVFYTWPDLEQVGEVVLPEQPQGEAIAVDADDRIHLTSEGQESPVLFISLPEELRAALDAPVRGNGPTIVETPEGFEPPEANDEPGLSLGPGRVNWLVGGLLGIGVVVLLVRALRPR